MTRTKLPPKNPARFKAVQDELVRKFHTAARRWAFVGAVLAALSLIAFAVGGAVGSIDLIQAPTL
jgi:hypothetical protein